jgi:hypothetical protein
MLKGTVSMTNDLSERSAQDGQVQGVGRDTIIVSKIASDKAHCCLLEDLLLPRSWYSKNLQALRHLCNRGNQDRRLTITEQQINPD